MKKMNIDEQKEFIRNYRLNQIATLEDIISELNKKATRQQKSSRIRNQRCSFENIKLQSYGMDFSYDENDQLVPFVRWTIRFTPKKIFINEEDADDELTISVHFDMPPPSHEPEGSLHQRGMHKPSHNISHPSLFMPI